MDLDKFRSLGDTSADRVIDVIQGQRPDLWASDTWKGFTHNNHSPDPEWPVELLALIHQSEEELLLVSQRMLTDSQSFFQKNRPLVFLCLGLYSLPYCYAAADGAKVLYHSKRMREAPGKRLEETASFVLDVCEPGAFGTKGKAFRSILKVRLMHALTRYYLRNQPFWETDWGVPINQEDMAGTNIAFSVVVLRGLRKLGIDITAKESANFLQYWQLVSTLLGVDTSLLASQAKDALQLERMIAKRHFRKSKEGLELTASLRKHIEAEMKSKSVKMPVGGLMAHLLGPQVSELLGVTSSIAESLVARSFVGLSKWQQIIGFDFLWQKDEIDRINL